MAAQSEAIDFMIVSGLLHIPDFSRVVIANIKPELIEDDALAHCVKFMINYNISYSALPTKEALEASVESSTLAQDTVDSIKTWCDKLFSPKLIENINKQNLKWMLDVSEKRLRERACFLTVMQSLDIIDGTNKKLTPEAIPDLFRDAISIKFDSKLGHDYILDADSRFEFYHQTEQRIPFSLSILNHIMGGHGAPKKAMIGFVAPTGVGKSTILTSESAFWLTKGYNVLYITLELAEERVAERIDAKLFDIAVDEIKTLPKGAFDNKINRIKGKSNGKLIIKEYPAGTFNANNLRYLLSELKNKKGFVPDIVVGDYLSLFASVRGSRGDNSYTTLKLTAEELRGVALEHNFLFATAVQTNRSGQGAGDYDLGEVADSHGISMTMDAMFGMISTPELEALKHIKFKQLKNRFGDLNKFNTWICGIERAKMSIFDLDASVYASAKTAVGGSAPATTPPTNKFKF